MNSGCLPLSPDRRDDNFSHSRFFGAVSPTQLPKTLGRKPLKIVNQGQTQFCTAAGTSSASEYQEGIPLSFEFQVAAISRMSGYPITSGADPRMALKAAVAYGSLAETLSNLHLDTNSPEVIANYQAWPEQAWRNAQKHLKAAFFKVDGPYDAFDAIRVALWQGATDNSVVIAFGKWFSEWSQPVPSFPRNLTGYHCFVFIDFVTINGIEYLVAQNSYGDDFGDHGLQYFSRDTINEAWKDVGNDGTGLYIFRDANPNDIQTLKDQQLSLLQILLDIYEKLLFKLKYGLPQFFKSAITERSRFP